MKTPSPRKRRTVLKTLGLGLTGGAALSGTVSAHSVKQNGKGGNVPVFPTWANDDIWEMIDAEPHKRGRYQDAEGNESAHRPLYVIESLADTDLPGAEHSPQFAGADEVVSPPNSAGGMYSAQWHVHYVLEEGKGFDELLSEGLSALASKDHDDKYLTSSTRIENAENVNIIPGVEVFTCPVRPHRG